MSDRVRGVHASADPYGLSPTTLALEEGLKEMMELKGAVVTAIGEQLLNQAVGGFCCRGGPRAAQLEALAQKRARVLEWKW